MILQRLCSFLMAIGFIGVSLALDDNRVVVYLGLALGVRSTYSAMDERVWWFRWSGVVSPAVKAHPPGVLQQGMSLFKRIAPAI